jgi:hypothetical protein
LREFRELLSTAVDHANSNADLMKKCELFGK